MAILLSDICYLPSELPMFYSNSRPISHHLRVRYRDALVVTNAVLQIDVLLLLVFYTTTMSLSVTIYLLPDTAILRGVCE